MDWFNIGWYSKSAIITDTRLVFITSTINLAQIWSTDCGLKQFALLDHSLDFYFLVDRIQLLNFIETIFVYSFGSP